ncbi:uncharacterized protein Triagg1_8074 [Trichoderma aggressivum f. europaeum]|uniref:Uncharacterized protein n=1 Tax=Trichoderma aggressivum f. europaeum TaxID=173218 RepID=A0AAE1ICJ9_9HYPO|nr:hypothetical protein Triagg1_8074 [Trichoderma aggressivum f. europaeum]
MSSRNVVQVGPAHAQAESRLMRLPRELRTIIYTFLFSSTRFTSGTRYIPRAAIIHFVPAPHGLALLLSCRRAYIEVGKSWVSQVHFCFEDAKAMLDKLADISLDTRSMIRHVRVLGGPILICYRREAAVWHTYQLLKLLPGLKLDRLTVCDIDEAQTSYDAVSRLVKYSDGWKELHYKSHASRFIGFVPARLNELNENAGEQRLFREPQPGGWQQKLEDRDGSSSEASVTIYRSDIPRPNYSTPYRSRAGKWIKFTQALAPDQDIGDYQKVKDPQLMDRSEMDKEVLVVVKRGRGVDYEEKQGSPYLNAGDGDIRERFPGKTWVEIKASKDIFRYLSAGVVYPDRYQWKERHLDFVDHYTHVDDYVWSHTSVFRGAD